MNSGIHSFNTRFQRTRLALVGAGLTAVITSHFSAQATARPAHSTKVHETKLGSCPVHRIDCCDALLGVPDRAAWTFARLQQEGSQGTDAKRSKPLAQIMKPLCEAREDILEPKPIVDPKTKAVLGYRIGLLERRGVTYSGRQRKSDPGVVGGVREDPIAKKRPEEDTEMAKRVRAKLQTLRNKIPKDTEAGSDLQLRKSFGEIRSLTDEARKRADEKRFDKCDEACRQIEALIRQECQRL